MFTKLLRDEWGKNIDNSMQPNNDSVVVDQCDKDDKDNNNDMSHNFPYQIDSSSLNPTLSVLLNDPSTQENDFHKLYISLYIIFIIKIGSI